MQETLFNPALWMPLALAILGIAVLVFGNARLKTGIRNAGAGLVGLALAWAVTAHFVDTFVEKCVNRTDAIVDAVETQDWAQLRTLLDKNTTLATLRGAEEISSTAEAWAGLAQLKEIRILGHDLQTVPGGVDVTINTFVEATTPSTSTWTFSYEARSDGILLRRIAPVRLNNRPLEEIERVIGRISK